MGNNGFRITALHGVLMIFAGMFIAGIPLSSVVIRDVYSNATMFDMPGDHRGWVMAHLEGLLNGMLVIVLAAATRIRQSMTASFEKCLVIMLLLMGWGNTVASILAPIWEVRGITASDSAANNIVFAIYIAALFAALASVGMVVKHLARPVGE